MPLFMDVHEGFKGVTRQQLEEAHRKDLENEKKEQGVHYTKTWADPVSGKAFCLSEGPSKEAVKRVHELSGHPASEIYELPIYIG